MKKVLEYTAVVLVILALGITFAIDRMDKYTLGSKNVIETTTDSCDSIDTNKHDIEVLNQINSIDSIVDTQKGVNNNMLIKTKRYKDSVNLLKINILKEKTSYEKEKEINQKEKEFYKKQSEELEQQKYLLQQERDTLNNKYVKEQQLNQSYNTSIKQIRDSLIRSDTLIKSKKKPK
jgi:hypothetical protein